MTAGVLKTVNVPTSLKERAVEAKWQTRKTVSEQVAAIVKDIATGQVEITGTPTEPYAPVRYTVDPDLYAAAAEGCSNMGLTLSEVVRAELERRLTAENL